MYIYRTYQPARRYPNFHEHYPISGLLPINSTKLEPSTCSERTCEYSPSSQHSIWISRQELHGCNCCIYNEQLVSDGTKWKINGVDYGMYNV